MKFQLPVIPACLLIAVGMLLAATPAARADDLSPEDKAFFDKHATDIVRLEPGKVTDPTFVHVFALPVFHVKVVIKQGDGDGSMDLVVAKMDDKLVSVSRPGTDSDLPDFPKMISPSFALKSDADAKDMQAAMDLIYPLITDDEKKAEAFHHEGNKWTFIRGPFFNNKMGFVFETDASGKITSAKYSLKLP
jgi:hypothetical protein